MKRNNPARALASLLLIGSFVVLVVGAAGNQKAKTGDAKPLVFNGVGTGSTQYFEVRKGARLHWRIIKAEASESLQVDVLDLHDKPISSPVLEQGVGSGAEDLPKDHKIVRLNITANRGLVWRLSTSAKGLEIANRQGETIPGQTASATVAQTTADTHQPGESVEGSQGH